MTISYPISLPASPAPAEMEWRTPTVGGRNVSPYTLAQETFEWPGNRRRISVRYPAMTRALGDPLRAALQSLYGVGTFLFGPAGPGKTARGIATGTPLVNGANQKGKVIITDGWTVSVTGILLAGDEIQLGSGATARLHTNLKNVNSDGSGNATLDLWPPVNAPADNAAIVVSSAQGVFRLAGPPQWDVDEAYVYTVSFEAEEAF